METGHDNVRSAMRMGDIPNRALLRSPMNCDHCGAEDAEPAYDDTYLELLPRGADLWLCRQCFEIAIEEESQ